MASRWTWTTNDTAVYTNWAADQPTDPSIYQCASVREDTYLWQKELCSSSRPFVCNAPATSSGQFSCSFDFYFQVTPLVTQDTLNTIINAIGYVIRYVPFNIYLSRRLITSSVPWTSMTVSNSVEIIKMQRCQELHLWENKIILRV